MAETNDVRDKRLQDVHARALERFDRSYTAQRDIREQCLQARRFVFVPGAQYDGDLGEQFANRPRFEVNKVHQSVIRIFSEYRNNRVTVDFRPDEEGASEDDAEFLDGLYRADEQESGAQEAYDTAFEEGVAGGMGAWRLMNCYEDEEDEDDDRRRIRFVPIPDADSSVFFDADAKRYDKSDGGHAFVITGMTADSYGDEYDEDADSCCGEYNARKRLAGEDIVSFDRINLVGQFDWFTPEQVYVAEYYEVEMVKDTVYAYVSPTGEEEKLKRSDFETPAELAAAQKDLADQGFNLQRTKKTKKRRVHKYIIDGNKVLEDCGFIAGSEIPVIPYYAKRLFVDGVERFMGQVGLATDAQRLYNMLVSLLAEISVDSPSERPIFTPEQIAGHEGMWAEKDIKRFPYLLVNPMTDPATGQVVPTGPIAYTKPPAIPPALAGLIQLLGGDLGELLGASGEQQEVVSNISAKAVELIQNRLDMQNFIYMDNFKKSMKRCGEVWKSMCQELYDEDDRPMRVVKLDGSDEIKKLRQPSVKDEKTVYQNDPKAGKFKVIADVGPSFTTRRDGTVRAVTGMLQFVQDPADQAVLTAVAVKNLEGEGLDPVKKHFRMKLLQLGLEEPSDDERQQLDAAAQKANEPDAQQTFLLASAQKALADAEKARAAAKESEAKAAESLAKIQALPLEQLLALVDRLPQDMGAQPAPAPAAEPAAQPA